MLINELKLLFVHIPKTGGQSVEEMILQGMGLRWADGEQFLICKNQDAALGPPQLTHLTAEEYLENGFLGWNEFKCYYKFTIIRNPWERIVSEYNFRYKYSYSFREFILQKFPDNIYDEYVTGKACKRHIIPQVEFIYDSYGNKLVDEVFDIKELKNCPQKISGKAGIPAKRLPHRNKTFNKRSHLKSLLLAKTRPKDDYRKYYDKILRERVRDYYISDVERFGYSFN